MGVVRYKEDEIPPLTPEYVAAVKALDQKIAGGEIEVDCSDMPEMDEFDFKYSIPNSMWRVLSNQERNQLGQKLQAAKEAERAAAKARQEAEQAIAELSLAHQT